MGPFRHIVSSLLLLFLIGSISFNLHDVSLGQDTVAGLNTDRIQRSTVYVLQMERGSNRLITRCVGSGTIIDRRGLIITNAHHTVPNTECPGTEIVIALSTNVNEPPVPTYRAEIAQTDTGLDLALLRITEELNGRKIESDTLFLPFVELADSDQVLLDDTITISGYPGLGNQAVEAILGTVSGFVAEPNGGERAWIKTDAAIPGVMTGGGVYSERGQLIGVSTTVPVTSLGTANCFALEDTNADGLVNQADICVPVGNFINAIRPSNFVRPLLRSASLGISVNKLSEEALPVINTQEPSFTNPIITPSVTNGQPSTVAGSLPSGTTSLFLFFDYQNMTPDTIYELRVLRDNTPDPRFSLAPVRWSGGRNGTWYIGSTGVVWPNGRYTFELFINGRSSTSRQIDIGIPPSDSPSFRNISFGLEVGDNLVGPGNILPAGSRVTARFIYQNINPGTPWTVIWYYNGEPRVREDLTWETVAPTGGSNLATTRLATPDGTPLQPGTYRLELYIESILAARSDFVVVGANDGAIPRVFSDTRFTTVANPEQAAEANAIASFPNSVRDIYAIFDWELIAPGTLWRMRWSVDDVVFYDQISPWTRNQDGENFITILQSTNRIADGTYKMELIINDIILVEEEAQVGIGQLPIDQFAQATGIQLNGRIVDSETGEGIPGVSFLLISEDFSVEDFIWDENQIYAMAVTDRNGRFQLDRLLQFDAPYSVIIAADGYLQIAADGVLVTPETESPIEVVIPLTKD